MRWPKNAFHCCRGHELTPENIYIMPKTGVRRCLRCKNELRRTGPKPRLEQCKRGHLFTPENTLIFHRADGRDLHLCKICKDVRDAAWKKAHPENVNRYGRNYFRRRQYGMEPSAFQEKLVRQNHRCTVCGCLLDEIGPRKQRPVIDHDHETGEIRDLFCLTCNVGLGAFQDSPELLIKAAEYLKRFQKAN
jgi:hypothetical protein